MVALSPGQAGDAPEGRKLLQRLGPMPGVFLIMDRAYEGDAMRQLAVSLGYVPVVPPTARRRRPWAYDRQLYKRRNEVERLIRRLKGYRRISSRYDKLDVLYFGFVLFALSYQMLCSVNTP